MKAAAAKPAVVKPGGALQGRIEVPGDKSITHRAIMLGGLARGETLIRGYLPALTLGVNATSQPIPFSLTGTPALAGAVYAIEIGRASCRERVLPTV